MCDEVLERLQREQVIKNAAENLLRIMMLLVLVKVVGKFLEIPQKYVVKLGTSLQITHSWSDNNHISSESMVPRSRV